MNNELLIALIGVGSTIIGSCASWFFTRKKYNSEVDSNVIQNMKEALDAYIILSNDTKERLQEALDRNKILEDEVRELRCQVFELMNNICYDLNCAYRQKVPKAPRRKPANKEEENKD
jgi:hypothetical protein